MIWYSVILFCAVIGLIALIMSYEHMKRSHMILSCLSILAAIGVFIKIGFSRYTLVAVASDIIPTSITENLHIFIPVVIGLCFMGLYAEGTIHWIWRRVHPSSAPTDNIKAMTRGKIYRDSPNMSSALMGTSTSMFSVAGLDVKTIALIRLSLFALKNFNSKTIVGIESALRLGDGRRYSAYHSLVAEAQTRSYSLVDIVHPYWRAINGNHAAARIMFTELCQIIRTTDQSNKQTINRIIKIGQALGLSTEDMGLAVGNIRL